MTIPGWAQPHGAKAAHYFQVTGEALCGTWCYYGPRDNYPADVDHCLLCHQKLSVVNAKVKT